MFKTLLTASIFALFSPAALAEEPSAADVTKLANAMHMNERISAMSVKAAQTNQRQIDQMMAQMEKSLPSMPETVRKGMHEAAKKLMTTVNGSWSADEATHIYATELAKGMDAKSIAAVGEFYASPNGQSALRVASQADDKLVNYVTSSQEKALATALPQFMAEVQWLAAEGAAAARKK